MIFIIFFSRKELFPRSPIWNNTVTINIIKSVERGTGENFYKIFPLKHFPIINKNALNIMFRAIPVKRSDIHLHQFRRTALVSFRTLQGMLQTTPFRFRFA